MGRGGGHSHGGGHGHGGGHHHHSHVSRGYGEEREKLPVWKQILIVAVTAVVAYIQLSVIYGYRLPVLYNVDSSYERPVFQGAETNEKGKLYSRVFSSRSADIINDELDLFFDNTGVQLAIVCVPTINETVTPSSRDGKEFAKYSYDEIFGVDQTGMVVAVTFYQRGYDDNDYSLWYYVGDDAEAYCDGHICNVIIDYFDRELYDTRYNVDEAILSVLWALTGDIPHIHPSLFTRIKTEPVVALIAASVIVVPLGIAGTVLFIRMKQNAELRKRILSKMKTRSSEDTMDSGGGSA